MRKGSIGFRLTLWYAGALGGALLLFGAGVWFALQHSMYQAVDESLRDRVEGVRRFIEQESAWLSPEEIRAEFEEHSVLGPGGDLFQVAGSDGSWLYRSSPLYDERVPVYAEADLGREARFENIVVRGATLRFLSNTIAAGGRTYVVQVAAPLHELEEGLAAFVWILVPVLPVVLLIASAGGYWISRRALGPVDEITKAARAIGIRNLSNRLKVPESSDELQRLSETLNDMIARLEAAFSGIARFTADASHELRTPLALVRTTAELALRNEEDAESRREALTQILAEVERMSQLVENLLWIARTDSGDASLARSRTDLGEAMREACLEAAPLVAGRQLTLETALPGEPCVVEGDSQALRRLFLILLDNAAKYTPRGGRIAVQLTVEDETAMGSVADTGIGIPAADIPHIFERFYRVDKARSRDAGGTGLGLAIAQWIIEQHGGAIGVESRPGSGTVFRVRMALGGRSAVPGREASNP